MTGYGALEGPGQQGPSHTYTFCENYESACRSRRIFAYGVIALSYVGLRALMCPEFDAILAHGPETLSQWAGASIDAVATAAGTVATGVGGICWAISSARANRALNKSQEDRLSRRIMSPSTQEQMQ